MEHRGPILSRCDDVPASYHIGGEALPSGFGRAPSRTHLAATPTTPPAAPYAAVKPEPQLRTFSEFGGYNVSHFAEQPGGGEALCAMPMSADGRPGTYGDRAGEGGTLGGQHGREPMALGGGAADGYPYGSPPGSDYFMDDGDGDAWLRQAYHHHEPHSYT